MTRAISRGRRAVLAGLVAGFSAVACASQSPAGPRPVRIVIDPGHTPSQGGAVGVRGIREVQYNDRLVSQLVQALTLAGFDVALTRGPTENVSLEARAQYANARQADLFLSIHHDSAQLQYLEKTKAGDLDAYRTTRSIAGYSIFVSQRNPRFAQSYAFAQMLGEEMRKLGRAPTLHHAESIAGESRELLAPDLGIYRFDDLVVLRQTVMPAVLLEAGVIVDPADEGYVSDPGNQARMVHAVVVAVRRYVEAVRADYSKK